MKKIMLYLAFLLVVPGVVYAGAHYLTIYAKDVYIVPAAERERMVNPAFRNYRLVWNDDIRKFELRDGVQQRSIAIEQLLPFQQTPEPSIKPRELAI